MTSGVRINRKSSVPPTDHSPAPSGVQSSIREFEQQHTNSSAKGLVSVSSVWVVRACMHGTSEATKLPHHATWFLPVMLRGFFLSCGVVSIRRAAWFLSVVRRGFFSVMLREVAASDSVAQYANQILRLR